MTTTATQPTTKTVRITADMNEAQRDDLVTLRARIRFTDELIERLQAERDLMIAQQETLLCGNKDLVASITADGDGHFDRQGHEQEAAGL